jgi:hypothetical protein
LEALVHLRLGTGALPAIMLDLSEQGLALQAPEPLPAAHSLPLHFYLPETSHLVEGIGKVIWAEDDGRAGMFFSRIGLPSVAQKVKTPYACFCRRKDRGVRYQPRTNSVAP